MKNLYEKVKCLFEAENDEEAVKLYCELNYTTQHKTGDVLYIYKTVKEAEKDFWEHIRMFSRITYNTEKRKIYFNSNPEVKIYFKSINECQNKLEGHRFKEIQFRGE